MLNLNESMKLLTEDELKRIHQGSLKLLKETGMMIMVPGFLKALEAKGAKVDYNTQIVKFPPKLIEETLEKARSEFGKASKISFNWHNNFTLANRPKKVTASFGGACLYFYDFEKNMIRESTADDMMKMIQLGQAIPEVDSVGNPLMYLNEPDGTPVPGALMPIKGAALIAKNCRKPATAQVMTTQDLEFIIEIGIVLKGSWDEFKKAPFLMSVKEPTSPLKLTDTAGEVLYAMAQKGLPCHLTPMPLLGLNVPMSIPAGICVVNAEILATWTAVKAVNPDAPVEASVVSGSMNMKYGQPNFAAPEVILSDMTISHLYEKYYHLQCDQGISWIDAKYPGTQAALERMYKLMACAALGKINYPTGAIASNTVFSPEQAMIDLEMGTALNKLLDGVKVTDEALCLDLIQEKGIGGNFFDDMQVATNYRNVLWLPELLDRSPACCGLIDRDKDIVAMAHKKWKQILKDAQPYQLDKDKIREIDKIVEKGSKIILENASSN
jgi:trimethylamine--corrinoid protein Co-methyltransferase